MATAPGPCSLAFIAFWSPDSRQGAPVAVGMAVGSAVGPRVAASGAGTDGAHAARMLVVKITIKAGFQFISDPSFFLQDRDRCVEMVALHASMFAGAHNEEAFLT